MADDTTTTAGTTSTTEATPQAVFVGDADPDNPHLRKYKGVTYNVTDPKYQGLSKNALKRLLREELWDATRDVRNKKQKEKHKRKNAERRKLIEEGTIPMPPPKRPKVVTPSNVKVVIDCSFSSYMIDKEIKSLQAQLVRCHSANRSCEHPMEITITSFDDALKDAFEKKVPSYTNWKGINFATESYLDKFDKTKLVYLSADSDNTVDELDEDKVYIIGGIVDKNRYKNLCQNKAKEQGIETAQLPIGEHLQMASRKVLTVNHVYEIMTKYLETKDWQQAFKEVIPIRKLKDSKWLEGAKEGSGDDDEVHQNDKQAEEQDDDSSSAKETQEAQAAENKADASA